MRIVTLLKIISIVGVGALAGFPLHASIADIVVLLWLLVVIVWQKESVMTILSGGVIGIVYVLLHFFRPELVIPHLGLYALGMVGVGFVIWLIDQYDVISKEFWNRIFQEILNPAFFNRLRENFFGIPLSVRVRVFIILVIFVGLFIYTNTQVIDVFLVVFFVGGLFFSWNPRISFVSALGGLIVIPVFLIAKKDIIAEVVAVHVYYFLFIGVTEEIVQAVRGYLVQKIKRI